MSQLTFSKAERRKAKARIALCAPAGGGKTHSALLIAAGIGGKIAVIDTENGSASLEVGKPGIPEFDVLSLSAPFTPERYIEAMKVAEQGGYDIIILDSISHAWAGVGGLLEQVDNKAKASKSGNSYTAWRDVTPMHNKFIDAIIQSKCHVIATMRTKTEYALTQDDKGRTAPKKIGMAPIQREGMDYEFTVVFDIDQVSHMASSSKDRTSLFDGKAFIPSVETGEMIVEWLNSGKEAPPPAITSEACATIKQTVEALASLVQKPMEEVSGNISAIIKENFKKDRLKDLDMKEANELAGILEEMIANVKQDKNAAGLAGHQPEAEAEGKKTVKKAK